MEDRKIRILLAEDDENLGLLLKEYLNAKGFEQIFMMMVKRPTRGFRTTTTISVFLM